MNTTDGSDRLEQLLRDTHYQLIRLTRSELYRRGITPPRFHLLHYVVASGPAELKAAAATMHVGKSTLTSLVDGLVADGLITRDRDSGDRRRVILTATTEGGALLERLRRERSARLADALRACRSEEVDATIATLTSIVAALERTREPGGART